MIFSGRPLLRLAGAISRLKEEEEEEEEEVWKQNLVVWGRFGRWSEGRLEGGLEGGFGVALRIV